MLVDTYHHSSVKFVIIILICSSADFKDPRDAKDYCKDDETTEYETAMKYCTDDSLNCDPPIASQGVVLLNGDKFHDYRHLDLDI
jgi:hypothetical protein